MAARVSAQQRIELQNVAEREILRYKGNHGMWHKHIHNVDLDPVQLLKMEEMDEHDNSVDFSCRRTGKTAVKEMWILEYMATHADQELGVVAPREAQSIVNLGYHTDAIRRSPVLENYLMYKSGRKQMSDTYYQFANRSKAGAYGIMAQVDGSDLTIASLEEVDDMPPERLYSRFLLTMGATRRLGASKNSINKPIIRITGVFKGADTLSDMVDSGKYCCLPTVDCYLGIELGILNEKFIMDMRDQLSHEEFIRQLLCQNVAARNLIWEKWLKQAQHKGLSAGIEIEEPVPYQQYKKSGMISFGYDASGHGENPESSRHALVVGEQVGNFIIPIFCKTWSPGTDEATVKRDLVGFWRYFQPDYAIGDAYGVGMLTELCDNLFYEGLTSIDRRAIGDGDSTASTWPEWPFSPMRFEGMTKHQMAQAVRSAFNNGRVAIPYVEDNETIDPAINDMQLLCRQLTNIKPVSTNTSYSSYKMVKRDIGDDLFDSFMAMLWGFVTRGECRVETIIANRTQTRAQLLGASPLHLGGIHR
ncbi:hypothetical protein J7438_07160 [Thalassotalea sp. G20_0]|uniref:hypothetical protein n=1 Tax=Thalassotalea sp. G20_0 TaxID=2821093 RepID=UPI001ADB8814|nr:hypothetical protein [Thalassotalea sp. G20_0]MBO9493864.1 hypothetical protein [Thalassotalea sp. G20_0]